MGRFLFYRSERPRAWTRLPARAGSGLPTAREGGVLLCPPSLQDTLSNLHLPPIAALPAARSTKVTLTAGSLSQISWEQEGGPGSRDSQLLYHAAPAGGAGSLSLRPPFIARDPIGLIDSPALSREDFLTPHRGLYQLIPQMMFINLLLEKYSFSLRLSHLCGNGKRRD